jgi:hypothetical protein
MLIRHLSRQHEVYLACLLENEQELNDLPYMEPYCREIIYAFRQRIPKNYKHAIQSIITGTSYNLLNYHVKEFQIRLNEAIERIKPDIIHVFFWYMAQFV